MFFSPSCKTGKMDGKVKHQKKPSCTLTVISVQSLSKLVLGNLVKKYESKRNGNNFSSFRIKTMVGGDE